MGRLEQAGPAWRLRFTRDLDHPVARVWGGGDRGGAPDCLVPAADHRRLGGGRVADLLRPRGARPGIRRGGGGLPAAVATGVLLGPGPDPAGAAARGAGTTLTLLDTFGELGEAARDAAGWHVCLDPLAGHLEWQGPPANVWTEVHPGTWVLGPEGLGWGRPRVTSRVGGPGAHRAGQHRRAGPAPGVAPAAFRVARRRRTWHPGDRAAGPAAHRAYRACVPARPPAARLRAGGQ